MKLVRLVKRVMPSHARQEPEGIRVVRLDLTG